MPPRLAVATLLAIVASVGCSGSGLESEVSGTVTLDGRPIGPGSVVFSPVEGTSDPADGAIQLDGSYSLKTSRDVGLHPGQYRASVSVFDQPEVKPGERGMTPAKLVTPEKYSDPSTSGLEYAVEPGKQKIDIELNSAS
jgi:hypothetical protein